MKRLLQHDKNHFTSWRITNLFEEVCRERSNVAFNRTRLWNIDDANAEKFAEIPKAEHISRKIAQFIQKNIHAVICLGNSSSRFVQKKNKTHSVCSEV